MVQMKNFLELALKFLPQLALKCFPQLALKFRPQLARKFLPEVALKFLPQVAAKILPVVAAKILPPVAVKIPPEEEVWFHDAVDVVGVGDDGGVDVEIHADEKIRYPRGTLHFLRVVVAAELHGWVDLELQQGHHPEIFRETTQMNLAALEVHDWVDLLVDPLVLRPDHFCVRSQN